MKKKNDLYLFKQYGSRGFLLKIEKIRLQKKKRSSWHLLAVSKTRER